MTTPIAQAWGTMPPDAQLAHVLYLECERIRLSDCLDAAIDGQQVREGTLSLLREENANLRAEADGLARLLTVAVRRLETLANAVKGA